MNSVIRRVLRMCLALLLVVVVSRGHVQTDYSGAAPAVRGLTRLNRDLMRLSGGEITAAERSGRGALETLHRLHQKLEAVITGNVLERKGKINVQDVAESATRIA